MKAITSLTVLALLLLLAVPASAQNYDWSHVGSVGTIAAGAGHVFTGPTFTFSPSRTGTLTARYNITNTVGGAIDKTPAWTTFTAAFTDTSSSGQVSLRLMQVDKCSNQETMICNIDSTDNDTCESCTFTSNTIDFANNFYYIQANIVRSVTSANIALHSVALN